VFRPARVYTYYYLLILYSLMDTITTMDDDRFRPHTPILILNTKDWGQAQVFIYLLLEVVLNLTMHLVCIYMRNPSRSPSLPSSTRMDSH
jgi:hypothetical protein